jgi:hypothetical protein
MFTDPNVGMMSRELVAFEEAMHSAHVNEARAADVDFVRRAAAVLTR